MTRETGYEGKRKPFSVVVITLPDFFDGEAACLEGLLSAGLQKLHIRKPGASDEAIANLVKQLPAHWRSRLVLHARPALAEHCGIPQVHCPLQVWKEMTDKWSEETEPVKSGVRMSVSLHSWAEVKALGSMPVSHDCSISYPRPIYAFISPLFDSISKRGYTAGRDLLRRPEDPLPCSVIGLGGINAETIRVVMEYGWDGAAVLGWIWENPLMAISRYEQLLKITNGQTEGIGDCGI